MYYVGSEIDWSQYGGTRGRSSSHNIIDMITYILYNQDLKEPNVILMAMIDFEKAFNRLNHIKLLTKLHDMNTPGWLLHIIKGFLENRSLVVHYKGEISGSNKMPGAHPRVQSLDCFCSWYRSMVRGLRKKTENWDGGSPKQSRKERKYQPTIGNI